MTRILQSHLVEGFAWTIERYHQAIELGLLTEDDRVELLLGDLIETMPIGEDHALTVEGLTVYFFERLGTSYRLRSENPVTLPNNSEPEPDFVIARRGAKGKRAGHPVPDDILLLVEVAKKTVEKDREVKGPIYAAAGIPEYWIINLNSRKVEVHTDPDTEEGVYQSVIHHAKGGNFTSNLLGTVYVNDLFP